MLEEYAHLDMARLRDHRAALQDEQAKARYWGSLVQARLELARTGAAGSASTRGETLDPARLQRVLVSQDLHAGRAALLESVSTADLPPLPELASLFQHPLGTDEAGRAQQERDLLGAVSQLSEYREALLRRAEQVTGELIARYRNHPELCLSALPLLPRWPGRGATTRR